MLLRQEWNIINHKSNGGHLPPSVSSDQNLGMTLRYIDPEPISSCPLGQHYQIRVGASLNNYSINICNIHSNIICKQSHQISIFIAFGPSLPYIQIELPLIKLPSYLEVTSSHISINNNSVFPFS